MKGSPRDKKQIEEDQAFRDYAIRKQAMLHNDPLTQSLMTIYMMLVPEDIGKKYLSNVNFEEVKRKFSRDDINSVIAMNFTVIACKMASMQLGATLKDVYLFTHNSAELFKIFYHKYCKFVEYLSNNDRLALNPKSLTYESFMAHVMAVEKGE